MRLTIPITGTVIVEGSVWGKGDLVGDPDDGIRPIPIDLGNVSWRMIDIDLENEVMIIEVSPAEEISEDTGQIDGEGEPIYTRRKVTEQEKADFLNSARQLIEGKTKDELYTISKSPRLKRPHRSSSR